MKFLQELVRFSRLDDTGDEPFDDELGDPKEDLLGDELSPDDELSSEEGLNDDSGEQDPSAETIDDFGDEDVDSSMVGDTEVDDAVPEEPSEPEDPNRQGMIRTVKGAHLVYKREVEDGTYEELWQYNNSTLRDEITIRKAILAGTDIPVNKAQSPDGSQSFETWAAGNAELMLIRGLQQ